MKLILDHITITHWYISLIFWWRFSECWLCVAVAFLNSLTMRILKKNNILITVYVLCHPITECVLCNPIIVRVLRNPNTVSFMPSNHSVYFIPSNHSVCFMPSNHSHTFHLLVCRSAVASTLACRSAGHGLDSSTKRWNWTSDLDPQIDHDWRQHPPNAY